VPVNQPQVILSGGAVNSPQLLLLSGVGDEAHLREMNISVTHHLPAVGQHMEDHLDIYVKYSTPRPITLAQATL
jgi:choline dehydrogenase